MLDPQQANTSSAQHQESKRLIRLDARTRQSVYGLLLLVLLGCHTKTKTLQQFLP